MARNSYLSQDRPDLMFASMQACCAVASPTVRDWERVRKIGRYLAGRPRRECHCNLLQSGDLRTNSGADWGGDPATRRSVPGGAILRGGQCLKLSTKKQRVVSLSTAKNELYAAVKAASEGLGIQSLARDLGIMCGLTMHLGASATMGLVNPRGLGRAKHVHMQSLWIQKASIRREESRHEREPRRLDDEAAAGTEPRAADENYGLRVREAPLGRDWSRDARRLNWQQGAEPSLNVMSLTIGRTSAETLAHPPTVRVLSVIDCGGHDRKDNGRDERQQGRSGGSIVSPRAQPQGIALGEWIPSLPLAKLTNEALGDCVEEVTASDRIIDSPCGWKETEIRKEGGVGSPRRR